MSQRPIHRHEPCKKSQAKLTVPTIARDDLANTFGSLKEILKILTIVDVCEKCDWFEDVWWLSMDNEKNGENWWLCVAKKNKNTRRNSAYSFSDTENVAILTSSGGSQPTASNVELNRFPLFGDSERHKWINKVGENLHCYLTNSPLNSDGNEQVIRHFTCVTSNIAEPNKSANFQ